MPELTMSPSIVAGEPRAIRNAVPSRGATTRCAGEGVLEESSWNDGLDVPRIDLPRHGEAASVDGLNVRLLACEPVTSIDRATVVATGDTGRRPVIEISRHRHWHPPALRQHPLRGTTGVDLVIVSVAGAVAAALEELLVDVIVNAKESAA